MAKKLKGDQVFTGQLLKEGDVVYLTADAGWSLDLQQAEVAVSPDDVARLEETAEQAVKDNQVIDVYPIVVLRDEAGLLTPEHIREKMRITGPSIAYN